MIKKLAGLLFMFTLVIGVAQADTIDQKTEGWCSPAVNQTDGNVTINCHGVSPKIVKRLEKLLDKPDSELKKKDIDMIKAQKEIDHWLAKAQAVYIVQKTDGWCSPVVNQTKGNVTINCHGVSPKIVKRLEKLIDKKDIDLIKAQKEIDHWLKKYNELKTQLAQRPATDELAAKAKALLEIGDLEGAEELLKKSLAQNLARRAQLAKEKESLDQAAAKDAYDLGSIKELQLDYPEAKTYYEQAASITPKNTSYLYQAGLINKTLANFQKAIEYYELALANDLKTYGEDHPNVATERNNLGVVWKSLSQYQKAIEYYELALASDLKTYGEDHPNVATYRNNLGAAWLSLGDFQKAIEYYELALASDLKTYGEDHPNVATERNNLGLAWKSLGQYQKAIEYYELALASDLKTYGEAHPNVARDRNNIGLVWYSLGKYEKAIE